MENLQETPQEGLAIMLRYYYDILYRETSVQTHAITGNVNRYMCTLRKTTLIRAIKMLRFLTQKISFLAIHPIEMLEGKQFKHEVMKIFTAVSFAVGKTETTLMFNNGAILKEKWWVNLPPKFSNKLCSLCLKDPM